MSWIILHCNIAHLFEFIHPFRHFLEQIAKDNVLSVSVLVLPTAPHTLILLDITTLSTSLNIVLLSERSKSISCLSARLKFSAALSHRFLSFLQLTAH